jgi:hypothetical protein
MCVGGGGTEAAVMACANAATGLSKPCLSAAFVSQDRSRVSGQKCQLFPTFLFRWRARSARLTVAARPIGSSPHGHTPPVLKLTSK